MLVVSHGYWEVNLVADICSNLLKFNQLNVLRLGDQAEILHSMKADIDRH